MRIIRCEECSNFKDGKCKEYGKERDLSLKDCFHDNGFSKYTPKKSQTYNDRINTMSPEEKAEFLSTFSVEKIVGEWCTKLCPQRNAGAEECDCPYSVKDSIEGWLKAEAKE